MIAPSPSVGGLTLKNLLLSGHVFRVSGLIGTLSPRFWQPHTRSKSITLT